MTVLPPTCYLPTVSSPLPVGLNLFISSYRFEKPITEIYRATWPSLLILLLR